MTTRHLHSFALWPAAALCAAIAACGDPAPKPTPTPSATGGRPAPATGGAPVAPGTGGTSTGGASGSGGVAPGTGGAPIGTGGAGGSDPVDAPSTPDTPTNPDAPTPSGAGFRIYFIDAEGGAATLLIAPTGETLLADSGWGQRETNRVAAVLMAELGKKKLDYFLATHYHVDHIAGTTTLARDVEVVNFIDHGNSVEGGSDGAYRAGVMAAMAGARRMTAQPGMKLMLGGVELTFLTSGRRVATGLPTAIANPACAGASARNDTQDEDPQSVGFVARYGSFEFVDLGDLTAGVEHNLVCPMNQVGLVDLFQVSQHGSPESSPPVLVAGFAPQVVLFNNGATKGGEGSIFTRWKQSPGLKDLWSLHTKTGNSAEQNADPALTANLAGADAGHWIKATAHADGTFTMTNGRTKMEKSYTAR